MIAHGFWFGPGWGVVNGLVWLAFVVLLVVLVSRSARGTRERGGRAPASSALHILEERYARGEISREEFLERRDGLTGRPPGTSRPSPEGSGEADRGGAS